VIPRSLDHTRPSYNMVDRERNSIDDDDDDRKINSDGDDDNR
jgi:hypothetical protein